MSITKSYNKHTNTYYAYETTYEWDDARQKKVQRKRCIGQFDPDTGEIIPNGKVGRPGRTSKIPTDKPLTASAKKSEQKTDVDALLLKLSKIEETLLMLFREIHDLKEEIGQSIAGF